ncbi:Fur family transcriptional regulator [Sulfitobacter guttiformis]|uniref:Ferric uptake regulation protein n=1 Tax=Sulfitobacter guttiformis TaxID=74349 RepID=A0A420DS76_9RHOB|nr:Fur family transcriptional regulator [Sulfitobacter guttiformis]KIN74604.1 Ferric uptake regulation protein [Sulfitobacter guttiformis KCTC 32187]RKE97181.1 Fur family ferric uptake transcriptional regulator [Sulfitobacter guttiformis]
MGDESDRTGKMTAALRKAGIRVTRQRIALLAVLAEAVDHPDAVELHERAKRLEPTVSLATVYRTLSVLEEEGVVHRHSFQGGGARFETTHEDHHDHILDIDTGEVIEFQSNKIEQLQEEIARELGYDVVHHRLELYCRKKL